jgi:hypothetical protein
LSGVYTVDFLFYAVYSGKALTVYDDNKTANK